MRKRIAGIALVMALAMGIQGCYGSFALTRKLWKWNGTMGHGMDEVVFLVTGCILPVYGIAAFVDAIVLNSVEFWSGKNPVAKTLIQGDKQLVMKNDPATGLVQVSVFEKGKMTGQMFLKKTDSGIVAVDPKHGDKVIYTAGMDADGKAMVADASGRLVAQSVQ